MRRWAAVFLSWGVAGVGENDGSCELLAERVGGLFAAVVHVFGCGPYVCIWKVLQRLVESFKVGPCGQCLLFFALIYH